MSLAQSLKGEFDTTTRSRGNDYQARRFVRIDDDDSDWVVASVSNGRGDVYTVELVREGHGGMVASCDCPRFDSGFSCKHIWATLVEVDSLRKEVELPVGAAPRGKRRRRARSRVPAWQKEFAALADGTLGSSQDDLPRHALARKAREFWYVLTISRTLGDDVPTIEFYHREPRANGQPGAVKPIRLDENYIKTVAEPEHHRFLQHVQNWREIRPDIERFGGWYPNRFAVEDWKMPRLAYDDVLPPLFETGRVFWRLDALQPADSASPLRFDGGDAWTFHVEVKANDEEQVWEFRGLLRRGADSVDAASALCTFDGLVLFPECLAKLNVGKSAQFLPVFQKSPSISVPFRDRKRFTNLIAENPAFNAIEIPESIVPPAVTGTPVPRLRVHKKDDHGYRSGSQGVSYADVHFLYDAIEVDLNEPRECVVDPKGQRLLRDRPRETAFLEALAPLIRRADTQRHWNRPPCDVEFATKRLPEIAGTLLDAGWIVEAAGNRIRNAGAFNVSVQSSIDWFELDAAFEFGETSVGLPAVLAAARAGSRFVTLGDGSVGMLPEQWLAQFGGLVELGDVEDGKVRFGRTQALLLDALLAAQPQADSDRAFRNFCRKLHSFSGVKPKEAPRTFHGELRDYQKEGLGWLHFLREFDIGGCLADDMGLGKTIQVLALLESRRTRRLKKDETRKPSLVVVPRSLVFNWIDEAERFTPKLRIASYHGQGRANIRKNLDDYDVLVTTYGTARVDIAKLKDIDFDYVILDESQAIKNANSQAAKSCRLLNCRHRLAMTGTPVENHLGELWSLFEFLNPGMLGRSSAFARLSKNASTEGQDSQQTLTALAAAVRPYLLRRTKQEVLTELPAKTEQTLHCELQKPQRKLYNELRDYYRDSLLKRVETSGLAQSKIHVLEALLRLRQMACHPGLIDDARKSDASAKLDALFDQLNEIVAEGHKALVFSQFTSLLSIVREELDRKSITYEYLDGKTRKRKQSVERFQTDAQCPLFLISLKAGGHGLNLTEADYVFILDPWWNPAVEAQAVDRAHRLGQKNRVFAYRLIAKDTVEERILELQKCKRDLANAIVSANNSVISDLTTDDLQLLLS